MLPFAVYLTHKEQLLYSHVNRLEDISERTTTESVSAIAWIPSNDIRFATITIPKLAHSLRAQAVIFELEERLLMDAAELHFAIVNSTEAAENTGEEVVQVACLPKVRIAHLLTQTKQHNITLKAAYPNIFLLPW